MFSSWNCSGENSVKSFAPGRGRSREIHVLFDEMWCIYSGPVITNSPIVGQANVRSGRAWTIASVQLLYSLFRDPLLIKVSIAPELVKSSWIRLIIRLGAWLIVSLIKPLTWVVILPLHSIGASPVDGEPDNRNDNPGGIAKKSNSLSLEGRSGSSYPRSDLSSIGP